MLDKQMQYPQLQQQKVKMLLVDDEPKNLLTLEEILLPLNEELILARSGREALQKILKNDFALVLLDVKMPGIDGYDVAQLMRRREESKQTPIIFITGFRENHLEIFKGYELGAVDYLVKPIEPKILLSKVRVFVELHRKTKELERQKEIAMAELLKNKQLNSTNIALEQLKKEAEQFAYIASHDLQTPLRHISSFVEILREEFKGEMTENQREAMDIISAGTQRMKTLIRDLLTLSSIGRQKVQLEEVDLQDLLTEVLDSLCTEIGECNATIRSQILPKIVADKVKIRQVFQNLIGNALKYCPHDRKPVIEVRANVQSDHLRIEFEDNGIGIEERYFSKIFEIFQRLHPERKYSGTGIGLAICKKAIDLHKGEIWLNSTPGTGSIFFIKLPRTSRDQKHAGNHSENSTDRGSRNRCQTNQKLL